MLLKYSCFRLQVGRDNVVGIETCYGLGGSGMECCWGRDFPHTSIPVSGPSQPPVQCVHCLFPGGKAAGALHWPPFASSAEVIERIELYYFPSRPSWPVVGRIYLTFYCCTELIPCTSWVVALFFRSNDMRLCFVMLPCNKRICGV
jgi:hypothetical protein